MRIELPWPPASLSGHTDGKGHWEKIAATKKHREWARLATLAGGNADLPQHGDVPIKFRFEPPNRRGDRVNFPNRIKPYIDGIAEALKINDSRFLPSYEFAEPAAPGRVIVEVS